MRRRYLSAAVLALVAVFVLCGPASAGVLWCRADPVVEMNGKRVQLIVAVPDAYKNKVTGAVQVQIDAPSVVTHKLIYTDSGFRGNGEKVIFTTNNGSLMPDGSFWMTFVIQVPMDGFYQQVPVQVELINADGSHQTYTGSQYNVNGTFVVK